MKLWTLSALLLVITHPTHAHEHTVIDQWYSALRAGDAELFQSLLADDARIELVDLGIVQSKSEFIASLEEWRDASKGLKLSYSYEGVDASSATAEVCYRFPSNSFTNLEVFTEQESKLVLVSQQRLTEGCSE